MAGRSITSTQELNIDGDRVGYTLHRVVGRKHVHLVVDEEAKLQVRAPWRFSQESAAELVIENLLWVRDALDRAMRTRVQRAPLVSGVRLPLLDEELRLELRVAAQMDLLTSTDRGRITRKVRDALGSRDGWIGGDPPVFNRADCRADSHATNFVARSGFRPPRRANRDWD